MITYSGVQMNPGCGNVPTPLDIAVGMCRITRYAGALWVPLAAHSILVAQFAWRHFGSPYLFSYGLLHDAHEIVTGEITRHYKPEGIKPYEQELDEAIFASFGLSIHDYRANKKWIKQADELALAAEATLLGLKGWPEYYEKREGHRPPELSDQDRHDAMWTLRVWRNPRMIEADAPEQKLLAKALCRIKEGDHLGARLDLEQAP